MLSGLSCVCKAAECQQNQLSESQHLPRPTEPQPAITVRQQTPNDQQRTFHPSTLHQDSVSVYSALSGSKPNSVPIRLKLHAVLIAYLFTCVC